MPFSPASSRGNDPATNEDDPGYDIRFYSSEYGNTTYRPYLDITYKHEYQKDYYLKDHLGNICVTVDENGDVKGYNDYYPFGLQMPQRSSTGAIPNDMYKFSGKELDEPRKERTHPVCKSG